MDKYRDNTERCFRKYYASLCYFASQYIDNPQEAIEDIVQDCFVKLLEKKTSFESEDHFRNHIYLSVKNACLNYLRRNKIEERYARISVVECIEERYEDDVLTAEVVREFICEIDNLPRQCSEVMRMSYIEGFDNDAVADKMQLSVNTVRAQKMRGKKILKENMKKVAL